jgi:hypothetical protein
MVSSLQVFSAASHGNTHSEIKDEIIAIEKQL